MGAVNLLKWVDKWIFGFLLILILPFYLLFKIFAKKREDGKINNILIIKLWALGDCVNSLPLLNELKRNNKAAKITVITKKENYFVFSGQDFIEEIIIADSRFFFTIFKSFRKYDVAFDLEPFINISAILALFLAKTRIGFSSQIRSALYTKKIKFSKEKHIVDTYLEMADAIGVKTIKINNLIQVKYDGKSKQNVDRLLIKEKAKKTDFLVGICASVGETIKEREWPKENFKELCLRILKNNPNAKILLIGTKNDYGLNEFIKNQNFYQINSQNNSQNKNNNTYNNSTNNKNNHNNNTYNNSTNNKNNHNNNTNIYNESNNADNNQSNFSQSNKINQQQSRIINLAGKINIQELFYLISMCKIFISNDTGPMHIAAAQGVKTIGLFGPNTPKIWAPYGKGNFSIFHPKRGCPYLDNTKHRLVPRNLTNDQKTCMDAITVNEVFDIYVRAAKK